MLQLEAADQALRLLTALGLLLLLSVWFDNPARLRRVGTAFAAYFVIPRGRLFRVGDRIVMGGVRGDVIALGFMRTTTDGKIFDQPVYNYERL